MPGLRNARQLCKGKTEKEAVKKHFGTPDRAGVGFGLRFLHWEGEAVQEKGGRGRRIKPIQNKGTYGKIDTNICPRKREGGV